MSTAIGAEQPRTPGERGSRATLVARAFASIADGWLSRIEDIASFTKTGYSFEEWLNWEAFLALSRSGLHVTPRPTYSSFGVPTRDLADLVVTDSERRLVVEVGLIHDSTSDKWISKLEADTQKLTRLPQDMNSLQVIVVSSRTPVAESPGWDRFLTRVAVWSTATALVRSAPLVPAGSLHIRAWTRSVGVGPQAAST